MGDIIINLDKPRKLVFDLNAMASYEEVTGKSATKLGENAGAIGLRALLWSCFIHEDETLTLKDVGKMINAENMNSIAEKLNAVIKNSSHVEDEQKVDPQKN